MPVNRDSTRVNDSTQYNYPMIQETIDMKRDTLQRGSRQGLFGLWFALIALFSTAFAQEGLFKGKTMRGPYRNSEIFAGW